MEGDRLCQKLTFTQSLINTMYNSRRLLIHARYIQHLHVLCGTRHKNGKDI